MASEALKYMSVPEKIELTNSSAGYPSSSGDPTYRPMKVQNKMLLPIATPYSNARFQTPLLWSPVALLWCLERSEVEEAVRMVATELARQRKQRMPGSCSPGQKTCPGNK